jgi:hypothetical protein
MKDYRMELLKECEEGECQKLYMEWNSNNMLYNSLMFSKLYSRDVEKSVSDASLMPKQSDEKMRNDIMTSWWTPTKIFLLGNKKESRRELEKSLLEEFRKKRIPMGKDEEQLRESLSKIRHEKTGEKIEKDVIDAFMGFLGSVYAVGNMTSAAVTSRGGALDNWDAKLKNIHEKYIKEEKAWVDYVKTNKFECYFVDKDPRKEIIPFWSYGPSKLANATDKDWKEYFENAKRMIEERDKLKA